MAILLEAAKEFNSCFRAHASVHQNMPAALVRLIQTKFSDILQQVFTSHLPVRWPHFTPLIRTLATGHFHPSTVTMPGGFRTNTPRSPAPPKTTFPTPKKQH